MLLCSQHLPQLRFSLGSYVKPLVFSPSPLIKWDMKEPRHLTKRAGTIIPGSVVFPPTHLRAGQRLGGELTTCPQSLSWLWTHLA